MHISLQAFIWCVPVWLTSHFTWIPQVWMAASGKSVSGRNMKRPCCRSKGEKMSWLANNANCRWFCIFFPAVSQPKLKSAALTPADSGIWGAEQDAEAQMSQRRFGVKSEFLGYLDLFRYFGCWSPAAAFGQRWFVFLCQQLSLSLLLRKFDCTVICIYGPKVWLICWFLLTKSFKITHNFFT